MTIRLATVLVGAAAILNAACDERSVTEPFAVPVNVGLFSAATTLPIASTNANGGALGWDVRDEIPSRKWAMIRVAGKVSLSKNPQLAQCDSVVKDPPHVNKSAGPLGLPASPTELKVGVRRGSTGLALYQDPDSSAVKINTALFNWEAWAHPISANRTGIIANTSCKVGGISTTFPSYAMGGTQTLTVEVLPDPEVNALETIITSGDSVTFVAQNVPHGVTPGWYFIGGDTLATPRGYYQYNSITGCAGNSTCVIPITISGRMYLRLGYGTGTIYYPGPIVWVGKMPAENLTVECKPYYVSLNALARCTAASTGNETPDVKKWFFMNEANAVTGLEHCAGQLACVVTVSASGSVNVRAIVSNLEQPARDFVEVMSACPRPQHASYCVTLTPEELDSIVASVDRQYQPPVEDVCQEIYEKLQQYLDRGPLYKFNEDPDDNPLTGRYILGRYAYSSGMQSNYIGVRDFLFEPARAAAQALLELPELDHDILGRVAFHEAAHAKGYPDDPNGEPNPGTAHYWEQQCLAQN
jgi:hypothetical protein